MKPGELVRLHELVLGAPRNTGVGHQQAEEKSTNRD
jgi:hypothetical protein